MINKLLFLLVFFITGLASCSDHNTPRDLNRKLIVSNPVSETGKQISAKSFNSSAYFIYRGEPMGFSFELMKTFAEDVRYDLEFNTLYCIEHTFVTGDMLSLYDNMIKKYSSRIKWDWRLLASLICQESQFNPDVESYRGAFGLMQIMPDTGNNFGIDITSSPENNMKAGIRYIDWLYSIFTHRIPDERERLKFILASYNAGPGHVLDAVKLAEKNGMNPQKWDGNVAVWLLKKSEPEYYNDTVVKNGFFKGTESVKFVSQVLDRFEHYKNVIPERRNRPF